MERRKRLLRERGGTMRFWHDFMWSWGGVEEKICERDDISRSRLE